jgi:hypothetical protein
MVVARVSVRLFSDIQVLDSRPAISRPKHGQSPLYVGDLLALIGTQVEAGIGSVSDAT